MIKNRQTIFNVVRTELPDDSNLFINPVQIGSYRTLERAEEIKGKSEQQMADFGLHVYFKFEVQASVYYDE